MTSSQLTASLLRLKLLDALRSGDTAKVDTIFGELSKSDATTQTRDIIQVRETVLHYAVQVAPLSTIHYLIEHQKFNIDVNSQDSDGNTPLHLAAAASRMDIVKYLLSLPNINDTIVNIKKKQPVEITKDVNVAQLMQFERAKFVEKSAGLLRQYFSNRDFTNLENLLVLHPRASELLDINGTDPTTGNTVLHEFIKKDDLQMCDWILKHGGDPFKRDRRGKLPIDLVGKNDALKRLLKEASKDQTIMDPVVNTSNAIKVGAAPTYKGYLRKWTNFASGYKLRYFVLDSAGILSYYTNQDDTTNACRGSLNLGYASLHLDSSEKLKFEIIGKNGIRWHLKANHPIETNRWVWTLQNAVTIAKDNIKKKNKLVQGSSSPTQSHIGNQTPSPTHERKSTDDSSERHRKLRLPGRKNKHKRNVSSASITSQTSNASTDYDSESVKANSKSTFSKRISFEAPMNLAQIHDNDKSETIKSTQSYESSAYDPETYDYDMDYEDDSEDEDSEQVAATTNEQVATVKRSLDIELSSLLDLFTQFNLSVSASESMSADGKKEMSAVGLNTVSVIQDLFGKYCTLVQNRDQILGRSLERQLEVNKLWENSIRQLEDEIRKRESKLAEYEGKQKQLKKYLSQKSGASTPHQAETAPVLGEGEETHKAVGGDYISEPISGINDPVIQEILHDESEDEFFDAGDFEEAEEEFELQQPLTLHTMAAPTPFEDGKIAEEEVTREIDEVSKEEPTENEVVPVTPLRNQKIVPVAEESYKDKEEVLPTVPEAVSISVTDETNTTEKKYEGLNSSQAQVAKIIENESSYVGYENPPRTKLSMDEDNRPKVGLWGILKSMIGKDMTRMTLPVSFNEPTSLLQRLSEDIEYAYLLDEACKFDDSTLRIIYVATFAASEYASTIDRIAKPFNPLLGETFEYCRPDQNYRLLTEQVSHHPPISACAAQSPKWDYYGENAVDPKFTGRSFDVKHLGKMFCVLRPDTGVIDTKGNKVHEELYSWKKVNTSVVGIIVGNPTIDNYGLMEVKNHTTGDVIVVDMKQRGWRASSAYQLSGHSVDSKGRPQWAMGGHWNSKIFAKKINGSADAQRRNSLVESESNKVSNDPFSGNKFLVWQAAPRPKIPFNLTAFATTLNGDDPQLLKWVSPSDTRLRPDQRAMEEGRYDEASDDKHRVETKQRAAKKERDLKKEVYRPNWFVKKVHPITGDSFWEFKGDYWEKRKNKQLDGIDIF
jgi:hypothetical protein